MGYLAKQDKIERLIFLIRGKRVMLDRDLAKLYNVKTGNLNKAVMRNLRRFPVDFIFKLTVDEALTCSRFQNGILKRGQNVKYLPYAFTDYGVAMLSSVLRSDRAIQINIQIMRAFTRIRALMATDATLRKVIEDHEKRLNVHDRLIQQAFEIVKKVLTAEPMPIKSEYSPDEKKKIGFVPKKQQN